jgi:hypothetical protein
MWTINKILLTINACVSVVAFYHGYYASAGFHSTVVATMLAIYFAGEARKAKEQ